MNNPKISIIVPIYNSESHLKECIESLVNQTYKNLEIILVNDGSSDNSDLICKEYAVKYSNILYFLKNNGGVSSARNYGISKSSGQYIAFVDSDDYVSNNFISQLYSLIEQYKSDLSVCGITKVNNYHSYSELVQKNITLFSKKDSYYHLISNKNFYGYPCNKLYKKELLAKMEYWFDESIHICEDFEFNCRYLEYCSKVVYDDNIYYYYYYNEASATNDTSYNHRCLSVLKAYESIIEIYKKLEYDFIDLVIYNYIKVKLNVNYRKFLFDKENLSFENDKPLFNFIIKGKNLNVIKKIYIFISFKFPIITSKLKIFISRIIK